MCDSFQLTFSYLGVFERIEYQKEVKLAKDQRRPSDRRGRRQRDESPPPEQHHSDSESDDDDDDDGSGEEPELSEYEKLSKLSLHIYKKVTVV